MEIHSWRRAARIVALVAALSALACTSDEQRALDHLEKGEAYLHEGQRTEASLEFQNALKEMEKSRKEASEIERAGAIEVSVSNPQVVAEWILEIDGGERGSTSGKNLAVTDVHVGIRKLKVYGLDEHGKRFSDESTVNVEGGGTVTKELTLS